MLLGSSEAGLAISLGAAIPWLCAHLQSDRAADVILDFLEVRRGSVPAGLSCWQRAVPRSL